MTYLTTDLSYTHHQAYMALPEKIPSPETKVDEEEMAAIGETKWVVRDQRGEYRRQLKKHVQDLRDTVDHMKRMGFLPTAISTTIDGMIAKFEATKERFFQGNAEYDRNKRLIERTDQIFAAQINSLPSKPLSRFIPDVRPIGDEGDFGRFIMQFDANKMSLQKQRKDFGNCMQAAFDSDVATPSFACIRALPENISKAETDDVVSEIPNVAIGVGIKEALSPLVAIAEKGHLVALTIAPIVSPIKDIALKGAAYEACHYDKDPVKCVSQLHQAMDDPQIVSQAVDLITPHWVTSILAGVQEVGIELERTYFIPRNYFPKAITGAAALAVGHTAGKLLQMGERCLSKAAAGLQAGSPLMTMQVAANSNRRQVAVNSNTKRPQKRVCAELAFNDDATFVYDPRTFTLIESGIHRPYTDLPLTPHQKVIEKVLKVATHVEDLNHAPIELQTRLAMTQVPSYGSPLAIRKALQEVLAINEIVISPSPKSSVFRLFEVRTKEGHPVAMLKEYYPIDERYVQSANLVSGVNKVQLENLVEDTFALHVLKRSNLQESLGQEMLWAGKYKYLGEDVGLALYRHIPGGSLWDRLAQGLFDPALAFKLGKALAEAHLVSLSTHEVRAPLYGHIKKLQDRAAWALARLPFEGHSVKFTLEKVERVSKAMRKNAGPAGIVHGDAKLSNFMFDEKIIMIDTSTLARSLNRLGSPIGDLPALDYQLILQSLENQVVMSGRPVPTQIMAFKKGYASKASSSFLTEEAMHFGEVYHLMDALLKCIEASPQNVPYFLKRLEELL